MSEAALGAGTDPPGTDQTGTHQPRTGGTARSAAGRERRLPWVMIVAATVIVAATAGWVLAHPRSAPPATPAALPRVASGHPAPMFSLPRLGGGPRVGLSQGLPTVVNFFASWCPNCAGELSAFASESKRAEGRVNFIGVDSNDSDPGAARKLLSNAGDTYPVGVDRSASTAVSYLVVGLPTTVFIDSSGRVIGEAFGAQTVRSLQAWIAKMTSS